MKRVFIVVCALMLVAGCSKKSEGYADVRPTPPAARLAKAEVDLSRTRETLNQAALTSSLAESGARGDAAPAPADAPPPPPPPPAAAAAPPAATPVPAGAPMLAYSYSYGIETPANRLRDLVKAHEQACVVAGPAACQMVGESVNAVGTDNLEGMLNLRATPAWLKAFRDGLDAQARAAGGRVTSNETTSEDLSRSIVDTQATLRAKTTLRDRLQGLLASHPGKLSDLLEVEQALAQVQGEIDATQSELAAMQTRVSTSALSIAYHSAGALAPQGAWRPLRSAVDDFLGTMVRVVAVMVRLIAVLLPIALVLGLVGWLLRKRLGRLRLRKPKAPPAP